MYPIICTSCGAKGKVAKVTESLRCRCGSTALDLDDGGSTTAASADDLRPSDPFLASAYDALIAKGVEPEKAREVVRNTYEAKRQQVRSRKDIPSARKVGINFDLVNTGQPPADAEVEERMRRGYQDGQAAYQRDGRFSSPVGLDTAYTSGWSMGQRDAASPSEQRSVASVKKKAAEADPEYVYTTTGGRKIRGKPVGQKMVLHHIECPVAKRSKPYTILPNFSTGASSREVVIERARKALAGESQYGVCNRCRPHERLGVTAHRRRAGRDARRGSGERAYRRKAIEIAKGLSQSNPGLSKHEAIRVAKKTLDRYPNMLKGHEASKWGWEGQTEFDSQDRRVAPGDVVALVSGNRPQYFLYHKDRSVEDLSTGEVYPPPEGSFWDRAFLIREDRYDEVKRRIGVDPHEYRKRYAARSRK